MDNFILKIHNYNYSERQSKKIRNQMDFLLKQIPYDSRVFLDFDYNNKLFYGKLKVNSNGKQFFASDKDAMLSSLTVSLCKKVHKQVMKWKKSRTVEEITGIIALKPHLAQSDSRFYKKTG